MNAQPTTTITLRRGYIDVHDQAHREVELRAPLADDEIKADAALVTHRLQGPKEQRAEAHSQTLAALFLIRQCTVQFGAIQGPPNIDVLRSLTRREAQQLLNAVYSLEDTLDSDQKDEAALD